MVTTFYPPLSYGGDATYVRALARSLVAQGHEVDVIASTDAYQIRSPIPAEGVVEDNDGVCVYRLRHRLGTVAALVSQQTGRPGLYAASLRRLLDGGYDVIHFHNISLMGGPGVLSLGSATKIYTLHEHWLLCPTHIFWQDKSRACGSPHCFTCSIRSGIPPQLWRYTSWRNQNLKHVDRLLSPSGYTADRHRNLGITRPITVLPLFSSIDLSAPRQPAPSRPFIIFVGRVTASKGVEQLARVAATLPEVDCFFVGDGDLRASLSHRFAGFPHIHFTGGVPQDRLVHYYRNASALVLPSVAPETFGLAIVEAAACGTPSIVATQSGGAAEIVQTTGGGVLYNDDTGLAAAIVRLVTDQNHRHQLGELARHGYEQRYTRERHLSGYLDEIQDAVEERRMACGQ